MLSLNVLHFGRRQFDRLGKLTIEIFPIETNFLIATIGKLIFVFAWK
jgi:hypothetical protein